jgi:hypothetical protein
MEQIGTNISRCITADIAASPGLPEEVGRSVFASAFKRTENPSENGKTTGVKQKTNITPGTWITFGEGSTLLTFYTY